VSPPLTTIALADRRKAGRAKPARLTGGAR
jgi:hypothetical protein